MADRSKTEIIRNFSGGLVTAFDSWQLESSQSPYIKNMDISKRGSIRSSYGYQVVNGAAATGEILGLFALYLKNTNQSFMVRMYEDEIEYTADPFATSVTWTQVESLGTMNVRNSRYSWTSAGGGVYYLQTQTPNPVNPGIYEPDTVNENGSAMTPGTLGSLAVGEWAYGDNNSLGYETLYVRLSDGTDPDSKSDGYITIDYDSANRFDGIQYADKLWYGDGKHHFRSWDGTTVSEYTSAPRGNIYASWRSQCWMAGVKANKSTLYYSDVDDFSEWGSGSAGSITVNRQDGEEITGIVPIGDQLVVFKERSIWKVAFEFDQVTSTAFYSVTPVASSSRASQNFGCAAPRTSILVNNDAVALSGFGVVSVGQEESFTGLRTSSLSDNIRDDLKSSTFGGAINKDNADKSCAAFFEDKMFLGVPIGDSTAPTGVYVYDSLYNAWSFKDGIAPLQFLIFRKSKMEDYLFFGSTDGTVNYFDNSHSYGVDAFAKEYHTARNQLGFPGGKARLHAIVITGSKSLGSTINCTFVRDYSLEEFTIDDTHLLQDDTGGYIGENYFGDEYFGTSGGADSIATYRYRRIYFPDDGHLYEVQTQFLNDQADEPYSVDSVEYTYSPLDLQEVAQN